jgi:two-component system LytT family response regulator
MKIKVVLVDDDFSALTAIKNYCQQIQLEVVGAYDSPAKFIAESKHLKFDVAILDYSMPQHNGLQLAEILNSEGIPVIFVTGHRDEIASKAWDINCIDCIEKPVNIDKIKKAISKFEPAKRNESEILQLELYNGQIAHIKINDIAHIGKCEDDSSGNDRLLSDKSGKKFRVIKKKMEDFMKVLPNDKFMRVSRSEIVSKEVIAMHSKNYEELTLTLYDGKNPIRVNISANRKDDFKKWFLL